jgi:hypothetical protein
LRGKKNALDQLNGFFNRHFAINGYEQVKMVGHDNKFMNNEALCGCV